MVVVMNFADEELLKISAKVIPECVYILCVCLFNVQNIFLTQMVSCFAVCILYVHHVSAWPVVRFSS